MKPVKSNLLPDKRLENYFASLDSDISLGQIRSDVDYLYENLCGELCDMGIFFTEKELDDTVSHIYRDLYARVEQDPIAIAPSFIYKISRSFKVIFYYRVAHALFTLNRGDENINRVCKYYAFFISEEATRDTAIEIHPEATIGESFVIDHGVNTLIGATSMIGNNCTLLNNVLLGSRKITFNVTSKRHPTLGNYVHLAGGVRVLGPVHIGDYTKIGPDCVIISDVPDHSIVKRVSVQVSSQQKN